MGNTNGREVLIADGPDINAGGGAVDDSIVINQGTSDRPQPQLLFHSVHGANVRTFKGGRQAKRVESFCKGLAFSNRPIAVDENICLRFAEVATNWSGVLRFGLTNTDPATLRGTLPKFACPDLTSKEGNYAKALAERYCQEGSILHFYVRDNGDLFYGINGVLKGIFLSGINTSLPLWVMLDIYGNSTALEFIAYRQVGKLLKRYSWNRSVRVHCGNVSDPSEVRIRPTRHSRITGSTVSGSPHRQQTAANKRSTREQPRIVAQEEQPSPRLDTDMAALSLARHTHNCTVPVRYHAGVDFDQLPLHTIRGKNVVMASDYTVAERIETEYLGGYIFTSRPVNLNEKIVIQIIEVLPAYQGGLAFGLTCCDPINLRSETLPDDSDELIERPEYWVGIKDVAGSLKVTDELAFWINDQGEVRFYKNNGNPRVIMHVDETQKLWIWFDIYGSCRKIRLLGSTQVSARSTRSLSTASSPPASSSSQQFLGPSIPDPRASVSTSAIDRSGQQPSSGLRVNLPPPLIPARTNSHSPTSSSVPSLHRAAIGSSLQEPTSPPARPPPPPPKPSPYGRPPVVRPSPNRSGTASQSWAVVGDGAGGQQDECTICMSDRVDCVIYTCGHMCMCFDCACEQWKRKGDCPICRKTITDVIRIYKS